VRKKIAAFCITILLGILLIFTNVIPLYLVDSAKASPNAAPEVIPSLQEWRGSTGAFMLDSTSRIVLDPAYTPQLGETARLFQENLFTINGHKLPVVTSKFPQAGDFFLTLSNEERSLGNEGYLFKVEDVVTITGYTRTGVFYGTQTALQILVQDTSGTHIPRGIARDYPRYAERGFMLDVGRKFFPIQQLENYVKLMAWYKMNDFQLHLNDNALGAGDSPDWKNQYAAFRLNSSRFKGLAALDGSYSAQDIRELLTVAQQYAVTITPEIDAPAHGLAFTQYRPDLASQQYSKEFLDLSNPDTYTFLNAIWHEFLPWFTTSQVHIGADEYTQNDANNYRRFINIYDAYMRSQGKTIRMWGSLSKIQSNVIVNTDVVIDVWNNLWANPVDMARQGYHIINMNDNLLYIVPKAGYYHDYLDTRLLYEQWQPYIFDLTNPRLNLSPYDPHVLGGMFAEWNDKLGSVLGDTDVYARVKAAMPTLGEKLWGGPTAGMTYDEFAGLSTEIGEAPGVHFSFN